MKTAGCILLLCLILSKITFSQVGVSADSSAPDPSAMLDVKSDNKGLLLPRMSRAQLNAISSPADGLVVYCNDCGTNNPGALAIFKSGAWYYMSSECLNPLPPESGTHSHSLTGIVWNWSSVPWSTGYKWSNVNDYATAIDMGTATSKTETGLIPGSVYTRYVWAYNSCGHSSPTVLTTMFPFMVGQNY